MASVTYDGRSFLIDGRRIWIVSAGMHYQRVPRECWADRLAAIRRAGFNTVETPIFWGRVEQRQGKPDWTAENDIRHFVETAQAAGLYVILRPGPYVGAGWDLGGLPAWLVHKEGVQLRAPNQPFLESVGKYFTSLAKQVRDLQVTAAGGGGPILLIQAEHNWTCGHEETADAYLGELARYLREAGFNVPRINANNLWASVEGDIDCWSGDAELLAIGRQLAAVHPDMPRLVIDTGPRSRPVFGDEAIEPPTPLIVQRRLGEALAGGAQFNFTPFVGGTSFGFWSGQSSTGAEAFLAPTQDLAAPIDEHGRPGASHDLVRRLATFASQFGRVFAHLDPDHNAVVLDASQPAGSSRAKTLRRGPTIVHGQGAQGSNVFIFGPAEGGPRPGRISLLLPSGASIEAELGNQLVHWVLMNVTLSNRAALDYCTLNAFASLGDLFVCFGPAGGAGQLSINGTPLDVTVPRGRKPVVALHEGVTVVVCSEEQIDLTQLGPDAVYVGASGLTGAGEPIAADGWKSCTRVSLDGADSTVSFGAADRRARSGKAPMAGWQGASTDEQVDGSSPRFARIAGPSDLTDLGSPYGYGWYRIKLGSGAGRKINVASPGSGDRLQLFLDGEPAGVLGQGPGAEHTLGVSLKKGQHMLTVLADNMGRMSGGSSLLDDKGMRDHLWEVKSFRMTKPRLEQASTIEPLGWRTPLFWLREGDVTHPMRVTWTFTHRKKTPIFVDLPPIEQRALVVLNDEPIEYIDSHQGRVLTLGHEVVKRGANVLQLALHGDWADDEQADALLRRTLELLASSTSFHEGSTCLTERAEWSFAKWEPPGDTMFEEVPANQLGRFKGPTWWRTTFDAPGDDPSSLSLDLTGLTKGQVYLNGVNLGRYFVQTATRAKVAPLTHMPLPEPWIVPETNDLLIFDEHGANPGRVKIVREK